MKKIKTIYKNYKERLQEWYAYSKLAGYVDVWKQARIDDNQRVILQRTKHELEFLPAAVEIIETPPSPTARWTIWIIISMFTFALVWSIFGTTDVVVTAQGKIIPSGYTKVIQPLERGIVNAINVKEGDRVKKGDVLIELNPTDSNADKTRLKESFILSSLDQARLAALAENPLNPQKHFKPPIEANAAQISTQVSLMLSQSQEFRARSADLAAAVRQGEAEKKGLGADIKRLQATIPLIRERAESSMSLSNKRLSSRANALEIQQKLVEAQQDLEVSKSKLASVIEQVEQQRQKLAQAESEFKRTRLQELREAQDKSIAFKQELLKAEDRSFQTRLTAPIDGYVQQLVVTTVGSVVNPAQDLLFIVPIDAKLEVEAQLLNRDRGGIRAGNEATVKVEAFPFTSYGTIPAKVLHVSNDAIKDEKLGYLFKINASMEKNTLFGKGETVLLQPGMAITIEVKIEKRRIINFLLSPIVGTLSEAAREK